MSGLLRVPCAYQGGKQRVASQIVDHLLEAAPASDSLFFDLCCGSAAISIELVNRGVHPSRICMLDISSWGTFWSSIGSDSFDMDTFEHLLSGLPDDKRQHKAHLTKLSKLPIDGSEAEIYPILQASSFGGKQIWRDGERWANACFRNYWEPTPTSVRRSPANPMQPSAPELHRRISLLVNGMKGVTCHKMDIMKILNKPIPTNSVVYVDPPYKSTTGYAYNFDILSFINKFLETNKVPLFVSEGMPLGRRSLLLTFGGANGGISGSRKLKHQEWLSRF